MLLPKVKKKLDIRGRANQRPEKPKIIDQALWLALGILRTKQDAGSMARPWTIQNQARRRL